MKHLTVWPGDCTGWRRAADSPLSLLSNTALVRISSPACWRGTSCACFSCARADSDPVLLQPHVTRCPRTGSCLLACHTHSGKALQVFFDAAFGVDVIYEAPPLVPVSALHLIRILPLNATHAVELSAVEQECHICGCLIFQRLSQEASRHAHWQSSCTHEPSPT